jgi:cytochrome c6
MRRFLQVFIVAGLAVAGLAAAGMLSPSRGAASPSVAGAKTTNVTVTMTDFKFRLSKKTVPTGTVIFTVVNKGKVAHDFKIAGKKTKRLAPGEKAKLTVKFKKNGRFSYICTVPGHAAAGMKGKLPVGVAGAKTTNVTVTMTDFKFRLSKKTVPTGTVNFTVVNKGKVAHDFKIAGKKTKRLAPGEKAKLTVEFKKNGRFSYICTVPGHAAAGMKGKLPVGVKAKPAPPPPPATTTTPTTETLQGDPVAGQAVFAANGCASCHTLAAAGATGTVGPNLDAVKPTQAIVRGFVQNGSTAGGATMPAFTNLSQTDVNNIAAYVYGATHH